MTRKSLAYLIQSNDFFGTLATVLDLLRQDAAHAYEPGHDLLLQKLRDDLVYMQAHCRIIESQDIDASDGVAQEEVSRSSFEWNSSDESMPNKLGNLSHSSPKRV